MNLIILKLKIVLIKRDVKEGEKMSCRRREDELYIINREFVLRMF